jgi:hypothetical protein
VDEEKLILEVGEPIWMANLYRIDDTVDIG